MGQPFSIQSKPAVCFPVQRRHLGGAPKAHELREPRPFRKLLIHCDGQVTDGADVTVEEHSQRPALLSQLSMVRFAKISQR